MESDCKVKEWAEGGRKMAERTEKGTMGIVGASGFIGGRLAEMAASAGWRVVGFSRAGSGSGNAVAEWRKWGGAVDLAGIRVLVNLAGEPVDQRWTAAAKQRFHESRVGVTAALAGVMRTGGGPEVWVNGSAVGIYGDRGDEILTEEAAAGEGYLAELCQAWEAAAVAEGVRVLTWRTGIVLGRGGAAWDKMRRVFQLGAGGRFGDGRQWMPWIHVDDLAGGILHAVGSGISGPVNGSAPEVERNADFTRKLSSALRRPALLPAPAWGLRLALGEFAGALLASQRVVPEKLVADGYEFRFPTLESALADLLD